MITLFILFLLILLVGYILGRYDKPEEHFKTKGTLTTKRIAELYHQAVKQDAPTGVIKPKTREQIHERSLPDKIREGRQAMREELDSHPELAERRRLVAALKKRGEL